MKNISGGMLIIGGIALFLTAKLISYIFPDSMISQFIGTVAELTWFIVVGIGIITYLRERKERGKNKKFVSSDSKEKVEETKKEGNAQNDTKLSWPLAILLTGILLSGSFFLWYFFEKQEDEKRQQSLEMCLKISEDDYLEKFKASTQKVEGQLDRMYLGDFERIREDREKEKEDCYEKYGK